MHSGPLFQWNALDAVRRNANRPGVVSVNSCLLWRDEDGHVSLVNCYLCLGCPNTWQAVVLHFTELFAILNARLFSMLLYATAPPVPHALLVVGGALSVVDR